MRILWFSVTPSLFNPRSNGHNGGGWIASLEQIMRKESDVQLGIAFHFNGGCCKHCNEGATYYTIPTNTGHCIKKPFGNTKDEKEIVKHYLRIIEDFNPDIIHIFGSENDFGLICKHTDIPIVIHLQGCIPPYHNALFPVGLSKWDFIFKKGLSLNYRIIGLRSDRAFRKAAEREVKIIQSCKYFMGRTVWDKGLIELINPAATYFHCDEALRDSFIVGTKRWKYKEDGKKSIISIISRPWYKGCDLILKTAALLKQFTNIEFEWKVYGIPDIKFYESVYGIKAQDVNVYPMGTANKDELVEALCSATCYVHPSYIDNSPNSICEAQILGVPVISTNVGGTSSIIDNGITGILIPANAPYTAAHYIKEISNNGALAQELSRNAIEKATARHNPDSIKKRLLEIYKTIIMEQK